MALALVMVCSLSVTAFASGPEPGAGGSAGIDYYTTVTYTGQATEEYTVTVPATLAPGGSGNVVATGTWSSNKYLTVIAPTSVSLANGGNSTTLGVTFATGGVFTIDGGFLWTLLGVFLAGVLGGILGINWLGRKC